jgi:hypothetical protein
MKVRIMDTGTYREVHRWKRKEKKDHKEIKERYSREGEQERAQKDWDTMIEAEGQEVRGAG